jgi:TrmH family RNA methyltransferase
VCVLEGPDLIEAALDAGTHFEALYFDAAHELDPTVVDVAAKVRARGARVYALDSDVFARVSDAATPQPLLASVSLPVGDVAAMTLEGLVMVLVDIRDPGNAGTLIRSADAAGASGVVFTGHSVDPFNPKTLRASAGSVFHLPVAVIEWGDALASLRARGARVYATVVRGGMSHRDVDFSGPSAVVIGNEALGLAEDVVAQCDEAITIEMAGSSESLNAGVAGSLVAFEALWQRRGTTPTSPPSSL